MAQVRLSHPARKAAQRCDAVLPCTCPNAPHSQQQLSESLLALTNHHCNQCRDPQGVRTHIQQESHHLESSAQASGSTCKCQFIDPLASVWYPGHLHPRTFLFCQNLLILFQIAPAVLVVSAAFPRGSRSLKTEMQVQPRA